MTAVVTGHGCSCAPLAGRGHCPPSTRLGTRGNRGHIVIPAPSSSVSAPQSAFSLSFLPLPRCPRGHHPFPVPVPESLPRAKYLEGMRGERLVVWYLDERVSGAFLAWVARQPRGELSQCCPRPLSCPTL